MCSGFKTAWAVGPFAAVAVAAEEGPLGVDGGFRAVCRDSFRLASCVGLHDVEGHVFIEEGVEIVVAWFVQLERKQPLVAVAGDFAFDDAFAVFCEQGGVWL